MSSPPKSFEAEEEKKFPLLPHALRPPLGPAYHENKFSTNL